MGEYKGKRQKGWKEMQGNSNKKIMSKVSKKFTSLTRLGSTAIKNK